MDTQFQGGDVNLYEGLRCHGVPLVTISRGRVVYENGMFTCAEGSGKFCPLRTFPDLLYKKMVQREKVSDTTIFTSFIHLFLDLLLFSLLFISFFVFLFSHICLVILYPSFLPSFFSYCCPSFIHLSFSLIPFFDLINFLL